MTLTIDLPPDLEKTVRQQAAKNGQDVGAFVLQAVNEKLAKAKFLDEINTSAANASSGLATRGLADMIDEIRHGQQARGSQGRSVAEIEAVRRDGEPK